MDYSSDDNEYDMWADLHNSSTNMRDNHLPLTTQLPTTQLPQLPARDRRLTFVKNRITEIEQQIKEQQPSTNTNTNTKYLSDLLQKFIQERDTLENSKES